MNYLTTTKASGKFAVVLFNDKQTIASFPASLNKRIPSLEEVEAIVGNIEQEQISGQQTVTTVESGKLDSKGREIGYTVYVYKWNATNQWYVVVQNARKVKGQWEDFGVGQRGKAARDEESAKRAGVMTAKDRAAKLK